MYREALALTASPGSVGHGRLLFKILLWLPQQTLTTPAHPAAHRPGRVYLKQASAELIKGGLKMVHAG